MTAPTILPEDVDHRTVDIRNTYVKLHPEALAPGFRYPLHMVVLAVDGFGCTPGLSGSGVFVQFSDGDQGRFERHHIQRGATRDEVLAAGFTLD